VRILPDGIASVNITLSFRFDLYHHRIMGAWTNGIYSSWYL
jgi:hypothetical protein